MVCLSSRDSRCVPGKCFINEGKLRGCGSPVRSLLYALKPYDGSYKDMRVIFAMGKKLDLLFSHSRATQINTVLATKPLKPSPRLCHAIRMKSQGCPEHPLGVPRTELSQPYHKPYHRTYVGLYIDYLARSLTSAAGLKIRKYRDGRLRPSRGHPHFHAAMMPPLILVDLQGSPP